MKEKSKSLTEKKETFFSKLIKSIKKIFIKESIKELQKNNAKEDTIDVNINVMDNKDEDIINNSSEQINRDAVDEYNEIKTQFFERYEAYKRGELESKDMTAVEILMTNNMLEEELAINKKISMEETRKINELNEKISNLEKKSTDN